MSGIVVRPVRFTDNIEAMQQFLQTLGLRPRIESEGGGWVDMVAGGGMVALHTAETSDTGGLPGETRLSFEADDVDALARQLTNAGVQGVAVYDEAYGQVLTCTDPLGDPVTIDGRSDDPYGYRVIPTDAPTAGLCVIPVRLTEPRGPVGPWLEALGLTRVGEANDWYVMYAAGGGDHGLVGLHHVYSDELAMVAGRAAVHLTFETAEALDDVAARMIESGYADAQVTREDVGSVLSVTDPDGRECQVHEQHHDA